MKTYIDPLYIQRYDIARARGEVRLIGAPGYERIFAGNTENLIVEKRGKK